MLHCILSWHKGNLGCQLWNDIQRCWLDLWHNCAKKISLLIRLKNPSLNWLPFCWCSEMFIVEGNSYYDSKFTDVCSSGSNWQYIIVSSYKDLAMTKQLVKIHDPFRYFTLSYIKWVEHKLWLSLHTNGWLITCLSIILQLSVSPMFPVGLLMITLVAKQMLCIIFFILDNHDCILCQMNKKWTKYTF